MSDRDDASGKRSATETFNFDVVSEDSGDSDCELGEDSPFSESEFDSFFVSNDKSGDAVDENNSRQSERRHFGVS